ncbi:ATP-binding cassette domain-containing protein [Leucobacter insecticola]|uniref:ATP-binding cassette domain-containing protein n=1 Tax=Leucobacter insecticola TaxID=2714934 RepID=A0A6G8FKX4_9MICO|nr:ATP-binding cassette domain-containing protein [Leucobacter insecticola]QIM16988.1 ATP-binding cassette domain-containing protein [Leucobacter insecticola]
MSGRERANGLDCALRVRRGTFVLDVTATAAPGEVLAVIGANGSGKSTFLGAIAGTHPLERGTVTLGARVLCSREPNNPSVALRRAARRVGFLDQRARLFPHLSARANIAFGPRAQGVDRRSADAAADDWLARVGLSGRGDDRPLQLSGGQQQRIAIARTLAAAPELLLLDEPFAALDVASSAELREIIAAEARRLGIPVVLVSHDPMDLVALASRVIVLEAGKIAQSGTVAEVLGSPATPFAAAFTGRVLLRGVSTGTGFRVAGSPLPVLHGEGELPPAAAAAIASFDPSAVRVSPDPALEAVTSLAANSWLGSIGAVSSGVTGIRVECAEWPGLFAELPVARAFEPWVTAGAPTRWELPAEAVRFSKTYGH